MSSNWVVSSVSVYYGSRCVREPHVGSECPLRAGPVSAAAVSSQPRSGSQQPPASPLPPTIRAEQRALGPVIRIINIYFSERREIMMCGEAICVSKVSTAAALLKHKKWKINSQFMPAARGLTAAGGRSVQSQHDPRHFITEIISKKVTLEILKQVDSTRRLNTSRWSKSEIRAESFHGSKWWSADNQMSCFVFSFQIKQRIAQANKCLLLKFKSIRVAD